MESRAEPKGYLISGLPLFAVLLAVSATGHAASNAVVPCAQVERDLQSLEVPVNALATDSVDHAPIDPEIVDEETIVNEPAAPVLKLGPRVDSILRDVFDMSSAEPAEDSSQQPSSSPLADADESADGRESGDASNEKSELPRFQRQMRRTDI